MTTTETTTETTAEITTENTEAGATTVTETVAVTSDTTKDPRYIAVNMTPELLDAIRAECVTANTNPGALLRSIVCAHFGIETTVSGPRKKYATDEERKEAKKAYTADRNALIKSLLAAHRSKAEAADTAGDDNTADTE